MAFGLVRQIWNGRLKFGCAMTLSDQQFNDMQGIFQEWGPRMSIPVQERWAEIFLDTTPDTMREWVQQCEEIWRFAYGVAVELGYDLDNKIAVGKILEQFPRLSADRASATWNQASYTAWK